jgi:DNA repair exonuclease SbcCD ATPase subunit/DNA repair exonuclease SbcCD nuclease subunit
MPLSHIFHLSDLHIRNGDNTYSRYEEYSQVFKETILSIRDQIKVLKLQFEDYIIVITGDIFHNKNVIGNYGLFIYREFIQALSKIGRLYIISGNHDYDQSDINKPSLVYSSTFDIPNVFVLNTSTSFIIDDVGFSFVSIDKTLDIYRNSGRIQDLPPFPSITVPVKHKIALFHGSFASAKLYNGKSIEETFNPYPLEWVKGFDYVLLGDIHKRQVFNYKKKSICGYSGSLIQQNFGEDVIEHGYLVWNLANKQIDEINVYNNIGYINIIEDVSQNIFIRTNGKYIEYLETYIKNNIKYFPKILEIKAFSNINYQTLSNILNPFNISFQIVSKINGINSNNVSNGMNGNHLSEANNIDNVEEDTLVDTDYLLNYFKKLLSADKYKILLKIIKDKESLLFDINKYPEELHSECIKRNKELVPIITSCNSTDDTQPLKKSFIIKYLEWSGLLCYENKSWVNFKDLDAKTFMIKGSNGTGKSAIYDILQLAIWATNNKFDTYSAGIINHNKDKGYTIVDIEIDNIIYRIKRDFCKKKNTFKITNKSSVLSKFTDETALVILKKDAACNAEVKSLFGDIDTFLSTSMITQNVDNDILSLNYKDTLATIDKSHNIQYIYHLYNLFKTAINKYKDFKKIIQSKKEVYEKLLFSGKNNNVNDDSIYQLTNELKAAELERTEMLNTFNTINIDINDSSIISIIDTDYASLIDAIVANYAELIVPNETYIIYKDKLNNYKYTLNIQANDTNNLKNLRKLAKSYYQQLEDDFNKLPNINKPCDISYLSSEEKSLCNYINYDNNNDNHNDNISLIKQKEDLEKNKQVLNELISNKPNKVSLQIPSRDIDNLTSIILKIYDSQEAFNDFISSNTKSSAIDPNLLKKLRTSINDPISFEHYNNVICIKDTLVEDISNITNMLASLEKDFDILFSKQQNLTIVNIPRDTITFKTFKTALSIAKELKRYNIEAINNQIAIDVIILNGYRDKIEAINKLDAEIDSYNKELIVFSSNDEYKYNPECCVCCKRPWVSRIKEIDIIINTLNINKRNIDYCAKDFETVKERYEDNIKTKETYYLLNEWCDYYRFKEAYEKITNDINNIINSKNTLKEDLVRKELELKNITDYTNYFNIYSFQLFEDINNIQLNELYLEWENKYRDTKSAIEELEKAIHYNDVIKPRITKYLELKQSYDDWQSYDNTKKIIDAYHYYRLKKIIEITELYNGYQSNEQLKPLIKQKIQLNDLIASKSVDVKNLNEKIVMYTTINSYNNENKINYNMLIAIDSELDAIIDVLDTILVNFQSFRKELYENLILNKLVDKTNKIIKTLCHINTKSFKLNYNVDISNDTVHINWLIHNDNISGESSESSECDKQYISVSQASGFQRFAISLALRLSLYFNNYDVLCNQLFIDEGFINFDKYNLSIVPTFLKSLLKFYNTIVILSHIDVIQDTVDETAEIFFDHKNASSVITYSSC